MTLLRRLNFDWQIVLWLLSGIIGWLIAYNAPLAAAQFALIVLGVSGYLLFYNLPDGRALRLMLAVLPPAAALLFVLIGDWPRALGKLPLIDPILQVIAAIQPRLGVTLNSNVIGGVIAAFIPLQIGALHSAPRSVRLALPALSLVGLILSVSRGAWLALTLAALMWLAWRLLSRRAGSLRQARLVWLGVTLIGAAALVSVLLLTPLGDRLLGLGGDRPLIWRNSLDLASDYAFTGFGLGSFEMAYASYALLTHVGHTFHAHNLWLDVWLGQGLLGVVALAGLLLNAVRPRAAASPWRLPALTALAVILIHGLIDDAFYGYGGAAMSLLLIPIALAARPGADDTGGRARAQPALAAWAAAGLALVVSVITPAGRALWVADFGALAQTRAELPLYHWPDVPLQDALRQSGGVDLSGAEKDYITSLALDPLNAPANRRLGQIELARGDYAAACGHLSAAFSVRPEQRATRQLYGECLALDGQIDRAVELWRSIDLSQGQLMARHYWYNDYLHDNVRDERIAAVETRLDP
jgi:tetratricopeptide (TPR) repeat protein